MKPMGLVVPRIDMPTERLLTDHLLSGSRKQWRHRPMGAVQGASVDPLILAAVRPL